MNLISYKTWKKDHFGCPSCDGYSLATELSKEGLFDSINPKDLAEHLVKETFTDGYIAELEMIYIYTKSKSKKGSKKDKIEIWYREYDKPFKVGQYIVIRWNPVENDYGLFYSQANYSIWGVWKIQPYKFSGIDYKMHMVPVGESAKRFVPMDRYTCDFSDINPNMIFDRLAPAELMVAELNK